MSFLIWSTMPTKQADETTPPPLFPQPLAPPPPPLPLLPFHKVVLVLGYCILTHRILRALAIPVMLLILAFTVIVSVPSMLLVLLFLLAGKSNLE